MCAWMSAGPFPERAYPIASPLTSQESIRSVPSHRKTARFGKLSTRSEMLPPGVCTSTGTEIAYSLSSMRKTTGSRRLHAVFRRLPELALRRCPVPPADYHDLIVVELLHPGPEVRKALRPVRGFRGPDRLEVLRARRRGDANDAERRVAEVDGHLASPRGGVLGRAGPLQEVLVGRLAHRDSERAVPVVGVDPVGSGAQVPGDGHLDCLVSGGRELEEDLALALEAHLPLVDEPGDEHEAVHLKEVAGLEPAEVANRGGLRLCHPGGDVPSGPACSSSSAEGGARLGRFSLPESGPTQDRVAGRSGKPGPGTGLPPLALGLPLSVREHPVELLPERPGIGGWEPAGEVHADEAGGSAVDGPTPLEKRGLRERFVGVALPDARDRGR